MDGLSLFFQGLIAFCAFFALLSGVIKMFILPMERDIKSLKAGQNDLKKDMDSFVRIVQKEIEILKKEIKEKK